MEIVSLIGGIGIGITGTIGNVDPANADSRPGYIYYAVEIGEEASLNHMPASGLVAFRLEAYYSDSAKTTLECCFCRICILY